MWSPNATLIAEGQYDMGAKVGLWTRWHARNDSPTFSQFPFNQFKPPFVSQANFKNDILDGDWLIFDADQKRCVNVPFRDGKRHGVSITLLPNGTMFRQAEFDDGVPAGDVLRLDPASNTTKRIATYIDGRQLILKTSHYPGGRQKKVEAQFLAPKTVEREPDDFWTAQFATYENVGEEMRHQTWKGWHSNGQLQVEGQFDRDKEVGKFTYWHSNGQKSAEGEFRNGKVDGPWVWWHENGQRATVGELRDGKLIGEWRWWEKDGRLSKKLDHDGTQSFIATPLTVEPDVAQKQGNQRASR